MYDEKRLIGINTNINLEDYIGKFLPDNISGHFHTLDGSCVAAYLIMIGYKVINNHDTGKNGEAETEEGFIVSTNGYVCKQFKHKIFEIRTVSNKFTIKRCSNEADAKAKLLCFFKIKENDIVICKEII